jgi:hypothetical protein
MLLPQKKDNLKFEEPSFVCQYEPVISSYSSTFSLHTVTSCPADGRRPTNLLVQLYATLVLVHNPKHEEHLARHIHQKWTNELAKSRHFTTGRSESIAIYCYSPLQ